MKSPNTHSTSVWMAAAPRPEFSSLTRDVQADACGVGAGIAGLTTAYLLLKAGKSVVVLEDGMIGSGETQRTTAHLSSILDDRFFHLASLHGEDGARLAAESHAAAIDTIERIIHEETIDCDFERVDGYLFNAPDQPDDLLDRELAAARQAGLTDAAFVERAPLPRFNTGPTLRFRGQAQFHPLKYLAALAECITRHGGRIFTDIDWLTAGEAKGSEVVPLGTGAIVRRGLSKIAVRRDTDGTLRECSAVCPHLGAIVAWNHGEQTWDCPAHGSRFNCRGHVLNGPANKGLQPVASAEHT